MARSIDMIVTDNLFEIIKSAETGPKICQKYIDKPYLMRRKKFDFRYMVVVKSMAPLEIYVYTKVFWFRTANNDFSLDTNSFTDYETHFTVMNYEKKDVMQQIFDYQFLEYLKERNIDYSKIYEDICKAIKDAYLLASIKCPQMADPYAKAIYALDVMIDETFQPKILEFNFSPDCTRACKYTPTFYQDIFNTLFLDTPTNCQLI
jgi:tubulin--tyrosine ligase-like protein 12